MRRSRWEKLERLAKRVERDGFHPTPAQLASIILDAGIDQFERTLRLDNGEIENLNQEIEKEQQATASSVVRQR